LSRYSNKIESVGLKKCPYYRYLIEKVTFTDIEITNISQSLPTKWRKTAYIKKLRHCHPMYKILTDFASWLRYCTDVAQRRSTKLCRMFGRLLGWYSRPIYTFLGLLLPTGFCQLQNSLCFQVLLCRAVQSYCTALDQRPSAKLSGVVQGMELRNFRTGHHLYSAGRPSRWASAHILVVFSSPILSGRRLNVYHTSTHDVALVRT